MVSKIGKSGDQEIYLRLDDTTDLKFGKNGFLDLILKITNNGFVVCTEFSLEQRNLLLRHDVDFDLACALELAIREFEMEIKSHFFFLSSSPYYELESKEVKNRIKEISNLGHVIGLHYDASKEKEESFEIQKSTLEDCLEISIKLFSQHNPSINGFSRNISHKSATDVMQLNKNFKPIYMSDSNMSPRRNFHSTFQDEDNIHLLLHPEYWVSEILNFKDFERFMFSRLPENLNENFSEHLSLMKNTLRDRESLDLENSNSNTDSLHEFQSDENLG